MNKVQKFTKKGKFGDYDVEVLHYLTNEGKDECEVVVTFDGNVKSEVTLPKYLNNCIEYCMDCMDEILEEEFINKPNSYNEIMSKQSMDLQMIDYLQREERMVKGWVSDLESLLSTFKDSEKVSTLPNEVTSQALPSIPHWESQLEFHNFKLEWLKSQINLFNNN